jgi:predicted phosphohydrolase
MPIFAVSDLHLSTDGRKSMDPFGPAWRHHPKPLFANWDALVTPDALVLIPGDLSWAMKAEDVAADYAHIDARQGAVKLLSQGNHDFGVWKTQGKARKVCAPYPTLLAVKSSAERIAVPGAEAGVVVAACCGALDPADPYFPTDPVEAAAATKSFEKEIGRLDAALDGAAAIRRPGDTLIVQIHYPPWSRFTESNAFSAAIESAGADLCVFGHLHTSDEQERVLQGEHNGVVYRLVGCDALGMVPAHLGDMSATGLTLADLVAAHPRT